MGFIPLPNGVKIAIKGLLFSQEIINTLYATEAGHGPFTMSDLLAIGNTVQNSWRSSMLAQLSHDYVYQNATVTDIQAADQLQAVNLTGTGDVGQKLGQSAPGNVAFCISFKTGHTGRSFRGRNYVAGIDSTAITGNTIGSTYANAIAAAYTSLFNALTTTGVIPVVASFRHAGAPRTTGVATPIATVQWVDNTLDSQRRRLNHRGE